MALSRRGFLVLSGGAGVILAATAGGAGYVTTRTPKRATEPWRQAGRLYDDPIRNALSYAITAPNPHNRQPWLVALNGETEAVLTCDTGRLLPETDPFGRQIMIGLGCFLEVLALAAQADGYRANVTLFPDGFDDTEITDKPIARIRLISDSETDIDPLFEHVLDRRSNKEPFDTTRSVPAAVLSDILSETDARFELGGTVESDRTTSLSNLAFRAHEIEVMTPRTLMESVDLMRFGKREIEASPDGIDLGGPFLEPLNHIGILTRESVADPKSQAFAQGLDIYRELIHSAVGYVWLTTPGNSRLDQIAAGRAYVRMNLRATANGIAMHPISQALQEYPEMDEAGAEMNAMLSVDMPNRLQMFARIGYGQTVPPSPRWALDTRIGAA